MCQENVDVILKRNRLTSLQLDRIEVFLLRCGKCIFPMGVDQLVQACPRIDFKCTADNYGNVATADTLPDPQLQSTVTALLITSIYKIDSIIDFLQYIVLDKDVLPGEIYITSKSILKVWRCLNRSKAEINIFGTFSISALYLQL